MSFPSGYVFLNGRFVKVAHASVSVFDRGLLFGDGLFETVRIYSGVPFALDAHIERLRCSARALGIPIPAHDWGKLIKRLLERNGLTSDDAALRITITRGPAEPNLPPPPAPQPTTIVTARPIDPELRKRQRGGISVALLRFARDPWLARYKLLNYVPAIIGRASAAARGCDDGIYADSRGRLREATTASLFLVRGQTLFTAPLRGILPSITRQLVRDLAREAGIPVIEKPLSRRDLFAAEEAFLTSSVAEIVPVIRVEKHLIGKNGVGTLTRRLQRLYQRCVSSHTGRRQAAIS